MNPIVTEFLKMFAREIASEVAKHITGAGAAPGAADIGKAESKPKRQKKADQTPAEQIKVDTTVERAESEWRADCLQLIGQLAPTHGPQLRALFATYNGARMSDLPADVLPAFFMELVALKDAA